MRSMFLSAAVLLVFGLLLSPGSRSAISQHLDKKALAHVGSEIKTLQHQTSYKTLSLREPTIFLVEMTTPRAEHTATALPDGRVLIVGGINESGALASAELFNPHTKKFTETGHLAVARYGHTAVLLPDGRVLIAGGRNGDDPLDSTEIFDPVTNSFLRGPSLNLARASHSATVLADGRILIVGGDAEGSAEIFDPAPQDFSLIEARLSVPRAFHAAVLLQSGKVLIAGGLTPDGSATQSAELFDPEAMELSLTRNSMHSARVLPTLRVLPDGKVQVIGGDAEPSMEMFNPEGEYFTAYARLLPNSVSLLELLQTQTRTALFGKSATPDAGLQREFSRTLDELLDRSDYSLTEVSQLNQALVAGGTNTRGQVLNSAFALSSSPATVTTDKTDYEPGETVIITGSNWQAGETVQLTIHRDNGAPDTLLSAVADVSGSFQNSQFVVPESDLGVTYVLTAVGQSSGYTAQTTFTDLPRVASVMVGAQSPGQVCPGSSATYTVTVFRGQNNNFTVGFNVTTPLPSGVTASFNPSTVVFPTGANPPSQSTTLTLTTSSSTPGGVTSFTVEAFRTTLPSDNAFGNGTLTVDTTPPTITLNGSDPTTVECHTSFIDLGATASDNCASSLPVTTSGSVDVNAPGTYTQMYSATDAAGNTTTVTRTVNVVDTTPPTITLNGSASPTLECHVDSYVEAGATASDLCDSSVPVTIGGDTVNVNAPGTYHVTYDAMDDSGNPAVQKVRTVMVVDTLPPVPDAASLPTVTGQCSATISTAPTATDHCAGTITGTTTDPTSFTSQGTFTVHWTYSDGNGNTAMQTQTVVVADTMPPVPDVTTLPTVTGQCSASATPPTAHDNCAGLITATTSDLTSYTSQGTFTVHWIYDDGHGNTSTQMQTVVIHDTTLPTITNPGSIMATCTSSAGAMVSYTVTASDNCPGVTVSCDHPSGSTFPPGTTTVTCTATDIGGNTKTCSFTVNVQYDFNGLLPPYEAPPKAFKLGSTIPLKWQYICGGSPVDSYAANPDIMISGPSSCGGSGDDPTPEDAGSSGLRYDSAEKMWIFNWQTKGLAPGCYTVTIVSNLTGQAESFEVQLRAK